VPFIGYLNYHRVKSHLSDVHPAFNDPENDQNFGDGYGVGLSLQFNRKLSDHYGFSIEPYIRQEICNASNPNKFLYIAYALTPQSNLK